MTRKPRTRRGAEVVRRRKPAPPLPPLTSLWCGQTRYACPVDGCPFDSLEIATYHRHAAAAHPLSEAKTGRPTTRKDPE